MEQYALLVQLNLKIDRLDLAQAQVKAMKAIDEDHTLTTLANAWVLLSTPGKAAEAALVYDDLIDKYNSSAALLNGLAAAKMHAGQYEEAEGYLQDALTKAPADPDSLANLIVVSYHLQRAENVVNRYMSQLKSKAPNHALVNQVATFEGAFDRVADQMAATVA
eukprot:gene23987-30274_t